MKLNWYDTAFISIVEHDKVIASVSVCDGKWLARRATARGTAYFETELHAIVDSLAGWFYSREEAKAAVEAYLESLDQPKWQDFPATGEPLMSVAEWRGWVLTVRRAFHHSGHWFFWAISHLRAVGEGDRHSIAEAKAAITDAVRKATA